MTLQLMVPKFTGTSFGYVEDAASFSGCTTAIGNLTPTNPVEFAAAVSVPEINATATETVAQAFAEELISGLNGLESTALVETIDSFSTLAISDVTGTAEGGTNTQQMPFIELCLG